MLLEFDLDERKFVIVGVPDIVLDAGARRPQHGLAPVDELRTAARGALQELLADTDAEGQPYQRVIEEVERTLVAEALRMTGGNQVAAASLLGINRTTLRKKLAG